MTLEALPMTIQSPLRPTTRLARYPWDGRVRPITVLPQASIAHARPATGVVRVLARAAQRAAFALGVAFIVLSLFPAILLILLSRKVHDWHFGA
jgi:hypothetical protein